ncbi:brahma associated protein, partial [Aphelenchoides avenae]
DFVKKWLVSQSKDLKTLTETTENYESERSADHFFKTETQEGVFRYLYGKVQLKRMELEASLGVKNN